MTNQHRAPSQAWADALQTVRHSPAGIAACLLELRARVEALEATQHAHADTSRLSDEEIRTVVEEISKPGRWQPLRTEITYGEANAHAQALVRHLSMDQLGATAALDRNEPAPTDSLVERLANILDPDAPICARGTACAAIRAVAAWMRQNEIGWMAASLLEQETKL